MSKIIKNPLRIQHQPQKQSSYVPEWVKLNKEPIISDKAIQPMPRSDKIQHNQKTGMGPVPSAKTTSKTSFSTSETVPMPFDHDKDIMYSEIDVPDSLVDLANPFNLPNEYESIDDQDDSEGNESSELLPGEYVVLMRGKQVHRGMELSVVEEVVENLLFKETCTLEDIMVLRRIKLKIGVLAVE